MEILWLANETVISTSVAILTCKPRDPEYDKMTLQCLSFITCGKSFLGTEFLSQGSQAIIEISCKISAFSYTYLVHYAVLFHNQGGYCYSFILQASEFAPDKWRANICGWNAHDFDSV